MDNNVEPPSTDGVDNTKKIDNANNATAAEGTNSLVDVSDSGYLDSAKDEKPKKNKKLLSLLVIVLILLLIGGGVGAYFLLNNNSKNGLDESGTENQEENVGDITDFDLAFLKLENDGTKNIAYSPLSIKYALAMFRDGANGETKEQLDAALSNFVPRQYQNSKNLSLTNALFINNAYKEEIKQTYVDLMSQYNAEVKYDDFNGAKNINTWVKEHTFGLIDNLLDDSAVDPDTSKTVAVNSLAIDMEWVNKIQTPLGEKPYSSNSNKFNSYSVSYRYEKNAYKYVPYFTYDVDGNNPHPQHPQFAAVANKYDIINELGEDNIRKTIQEDYEKWAEKMKSQQKEAIAQGTSIECTDEDILNNAPDLDEYVNTLSGHYGDISSSTDFYFLDNEDIKVFAKNLKVYDGVGLQYISIMPKTIDLSEYINKISLKGINDIADGLKDITLGSFQDGYITILNGQVVPFDFDYELKAIEDLYRIGIRNAFNRDQADFSAITDTEPFYITDAVHKTNIKMGNEGIKATAATAMIGGAGAGGACSYQYDFEVPIKEIDLSFDQPYLFLIRDKSSNEIWFVGVVNEVKI